MNTPKWTTQLAKCPCESGKAYQHCCECFHKGTNAPNAEALMRARYTAYTLQLEDFLLRTWHPDTRPNTIDLTKDSNIKWLGLKILSTENISAKKATVTFTARYKVSGNRAERLHEVSQFELTDAWYYLTGTIERGN